MGGGKYKVIWSGKVRKQVAKCPLNVQKKFWLLVNDLRKKGAIQKNWSHFSSLGKDVYGNTD